MTMHPKAVQFALNGQDYTLFYNLSALCLLRDHDVDVFALDQSMMQDPRVMRALLWAGLQKYHPGTTLEQVGDWLDLSDLGPAAQAFSLALQKASTKEISGPDPQ